MKNDLSTTSFIKIGKTIKIVAKDEEEYGQKRGEKIYSISQSERGRKCRFAEAKVIVGTITPIYFNDIPESEIDDRIFKF